MLNIQVKGIEIDKFGVGIQFNNGTQVHFDDRGAIAVVDFFGTEKRFYQFTHASGKSVECPSGVPDKIEIDRNKNTVRLEFGLVGHAIEIKNHFDSKLMIHYIDGHTEYVYTGMMVSWERLRTGEW